ncbi:MAG: hypothetical protein ACRD1B_04590, partial [Thermoanaerobaculia bacterium]
MSKPKFSPSILGLFVVLSLGASPLIAQNLSLQPRTANDAPFQLSSTTGFSVSDASGEYRLFSTFAAPRFAWVSDPPDPSHRFYDSFGSGSHPNFPLYGFQTKYPCDIDKDPTTWANPPAPYVNVPSCIDSISLFSKSTAATDSSAPRWT